MRWRMRWWDGMEFVGIEDRWFRLGQAIAFWGRGDERELLWEEWDGMGWSLWGLGIWG